MNYNQEDLEWLFRTFERLFHNYIKNVFEKRGIVGASNPHILFALRFNAQDMKATQKELGEMVGISPPTAAISIKRMEKAGILIKMQDKEDLRRNIIALTPKGLKIVDECRSVFEEMDAEMFKTFSMEEREQLRLFFLRLVHNLKAMGAQLPRYWNEETDSGDKNEGNENQ